MTTTADRTAPGSGGLSAQRSRPQGPVPPYLLRAWLSVGILVFSVIFAASRYLETVLTATPAVDPKRPSWDLVYPGGDPWMVGDWLINYGGGFVRRGLFGQLFLELAPSGQPGLWTLFVLQLVPYLVLLAYSIQVLHRARYSWSSIALVSGPAALPFIAWVPSVDGAFRKEILIFLVLVLLAWSRSRSLNRTAVTALLSTALVAFVLAVFSWEPSALLLPATLYLLLSAGATRPAPVVRRTYAALFVVVAILGGGLSVLLHGDVATAQAVCDSVRAHGFAGPHVCSGGVGSNGGAIEAIGWTSYKTQQDLALALPVYAGFIPLIILALIPAVASRWFRSNWAWAAFIAVGVAPLYVIVTDYGRWTHILAVALMVCITADGPADLHSRIWKPITTLVYIATWGMPHWMGMAQLGTTEWPRVGLLATATDLGLDRAWAQLPEVVQQRPTGHPLELAGRYLTGSPASGWDSWSPMQIAMEYIQAGGTELYRDLLFEGGIKFQYFPTSLLFVEPAFLYYPTHIALPMNQLSWLAVAGTVAVMFLLLRHLAGMSRRTPLSGSMLTALLLVALVATVTFRPVTWSWDLGQAQALINFLCTLSLYAYMKDRKALSGVALALAALLKPQLGLFALWGLLRRDWRFLAWLVGTAAAGILLSIARYGLKVHLDYFPVLSFLSQRGESYYPNQSVNGLLHRALGTSDFLNLDFTRFPPFDLNVYAGSTAATLVFVVIALLAAGSGWRDTSAPVGSLGSARAGIDFSIGLACFTLASPIAWDHHYGLLLPAYFLTGWLAATLRPRVGVPVLGVLAVSYLLIISELWPYLKPFADGPLNILYSYVLFAVLLLLGCMLVVRHALSRNEQASGTEISSAPLASREV